MFGLLRGKPCFIFSLDRPYPHEVFNSQKKLKYTGFIFSPKRRISHITVRGEKSVQKFSLVYERKDLISFLPQLREVHKSGFCFNWQTGPENLSFLVQEGIRKYTIASYNWRKIWKEHLWWLKTKELLSSQNVVPPPELIALTQGTANPQAYFGSILVGAWIFKKIFSKWTLPKNILDFGCGSGRLTLSWWLLKKEQKENLQLFGTDIQQNLIFWAQEHLPKEINFSLNFLDPPLPFSDQWFDFIFAVSVFTHLSFFRQKLWIKEFYRLLKPGGKLLLTLHGRPYVETLLTDKKQKEFLRKGFLELPTVHEGKNDFVTFHRPGFVAKEFSSCFHCLRFWPEGDLGQPFPFRLAFLQDVYLFERA